MTIAVDFDGTIVEHMYPEIGKEIPFATDTLKMLIADRNYAEFKAVVKARHDFNKWRPEFKKARNDIQKNRRVKKIAGLYGKSLLWQFYFKGRHKYSMMPNI